MDGVRGRRERRGDRGHRRAAGVLRRRQPRQPRRGDRRQPRARSTKGFLRIARSPLPTLAAVNGAAVGAGMNLALGCDVRLAARRAKFDTRFLQIGLHPGGGHTWMLRRIAGPQAAMAAVVFGEVLDGAEAERVGLAYRCVDDDALLDVGAGDGRTRPRRRRARWRSSPSGRSRRWPTSTTTPTPCSASSSRSCGAPNSRGSPSGSPRCRQRISKK